MAAVGNPANGDLSLIKVKAETKRVLEAFLKRSLSQDEGKHVGHVGRSYHDDKKYSHRANHEESKELIPKKSKKADRKRSKEPERDDRSPALGESSAPARHGTWNSLHEEINRVEETKHGFKTNIKHLLRKQSQAKEKGAALKDRNGSVHSKSKDSIDAVLDEHGKAAGKGDSSKRPKSPNPLLACTVMASTTSLAEDDHRQYDTGAREKHPPSATPKKLSRSFSIIKLLKKKTHKENVPESDSKPARPDFLPVKSWKEEPHAPIQETGRLEDSEIYSLAAKKLDTLLKHKKLRSPQEPPKPPAIPLCGYSVIGDNNNVTTDDRPAPVDKDEVIRNLVALLQEQAVVINEKINRDPFLRNTLSRMSYGSFFRLAEVFTSDAEVEQDAAGSNVSPELTKIALTMELTRKVAGINSHAVHTLMGYSLQYMDMFVPWLQKQGGWEKLVSDGDISDLQID
ncbi:bcl-2-like protein 12 [Anomaloglossus baeobatrachus]|uniref:bcl-2-like protein 12 n=1 Tax=Anomaloglossus baeobatrachus TaxID=238106 RepID=UPI003F504D46